MQTVARGGGGSSFFDSDHGTLLIYQFSPLTPTVAIWVQL